MNSRHMLIGLLLLWLFRMNFTTSKETGCLISSLRLPFDFETVKLVLLDRLVREDVVLQFEALGDRLNLGDDFGIAEELPLLDTHKNQEHVVRNLESAVVLWL